MSEPLPNEWFGDAWNAIVGHRGVKCCMYRACSRVSSLIPRKKKLGARGPEIAYRNPVWYKIAFINHKHNLLVRLFFSYIFQDALAKCAKRIARIQNMQQDV